MNLSQEISLYERELCWLLEQMHHTMEGLTEQQLHWHPTADQANSLAAIINHISACTRVYILGFVCGQPVSRDRSSEFTPDNAALSSCRMVLRQLVDEIRARLAALRPEALDERLVPPQELWSETVMTREITRREAFILSIRHAAIHLGELRLTSDLARQ